MFAPRNNLAQRLLSGVDLAIDLATLGEYGLEPLPAERSRTGRAGAFAGWEAPVRTARGVGRAASTDRVRGDARSDRARRKREARRARGDEALSGAGCVAAFQWPPRPAPTRLRQRKPAYGGRGGDSAPTTLIRRSAA